MTRRTASQRVVIVAPVHQYDDIRVFHKEAKTLARWGYEVKLLARAPGPLEDEGVSVVPLGHPARRLARFASIPLVLARALSQRGAIYHLHNPDTLPLAIALRLLGRRVVYDTHEDFSLRLMARKWIPRALRPVLARSVALAEQLVAKVVDLPVATQASVCDRLGSRTLLLENRPIVSGPLIDETLDRARELKRSDDVFRLVYVGRVTRPRGLWTMLDALSLANERIACRLWLIGTFNEGDRPEAERHPGWRFVDYLGPLPQAEAFAHIALADAGMVTILDIGDHRHTSPNKLFEYQVFGIPFIASNFETWQAVMAEVEAGFFVDPSDPSEVARAIAQLSSDLDLRRSMGEAGRSFVRGYNWDNESRKLIASYEALIGPPTARRRSVK